MIEVKERATIAVNLDRFEVTAGRFMTFLAAYETARAPRDGAGAHPNVDDTGWRASWSEDPELMPSNADSVAKGIIACSRWPDIEELALPMRCVNWYLAFAFCIWDGGRLPTEAEWTFAATRGEEQRYFPWSSANNDQTIDSERACYSDVDGLRDAPSPVGAHAAGAGAFGHEDLAGNVWEWTADSYREHLPDVDCAGDALASLSSGCQQSQQTDSKVLKGGSYESPSRNLANVTRTGSFPAMRDPTIGFRCVRDL